MVDLDELQRLLDAIPAPFEPLDASALDGFLCGVIVQPQPVPEKAWWPHVLDVDARPLPAGLATTTTTRLRALVRQRHTELAAAIGHRRWFDPWVFDAEESADPADAVAPWATGFAIALEAFPRLLARSEPEVSEPLALIYRHLDTADLEDADELLAFIDELEPPSDLGVAVEELVRATLLLADASGVPRLRS